jgi:hypothetical protein
MEWFHFRHEIKMWPGIDLLPNLLFYPKAEELISQSLSDTLKSLQKRFLIQQRGGKMKICISYYIGK